MTTTAPTNRRLIVIIVAILAAVAITWVAIVAYLLTRPAAADQPTTPATTAAETIAIYGIINLPDEYSRTLNPGDPCHVTRNPGLADIAEGAQVVITSNTGQTLAVGHLDAGIAAIYELYPDDGAICTFPFTVPDVPAGQGPYEVTIGQRGTINYTEAELAGVIEWTIE